MLQLKQEQYLWGASRRDRRTLVRGMLAWNFGRWRQS